MPNQLKIPFNRPSLTGKELLYVSQAITSGHISGRGQFTHTCEQSLQEQLGVSRALLTTSCTHALEMTSILMDIQPGDEVIVPSYTFVSTANAYALRGAKIVFADILPETLNIDHRQLPDLITSKTKAIIPVHYGGVGCEMDAIMDLANQNQLYVVEDNAHGLFATYKNKPLGSFGHYATQSFHETKNCYCGEGGALLIRDEENVLQAEIALEKGTNRSQFFRSEVSKYEWVGLGSSYVLSEILAAFLCAQLETQDLIMERRLKLIEAYQNSLKSWAQESGAIIPSFPAHCQNHAHLFYFIMPDNTQRDALLKHLRSKGILAVFHYVPLHSSSFGSKNCVAPLGCPVTEDLAARLVRLPLYNDMTPLEQEQVIQAVVSFIA